jgi:predicted exporter
VTRRRPFWQRFLTQLVVAVGVTLALVVAAYAIAGVQSREFELVALLIGVMVGTFVDYRRNRP